jgi:hypothetical protein
MLRSIGSPMTLVYGNSSELLRRSDVESFVQVANGARTIWLDGGHNLHHDAPDALARIIDEHASVLPTEHIPMPVPANDPVVLKSRVAWERQSH